MRADLGIVKSIGTWRLWAAKLSWQASWSLDEIASCCFLFPSFLEICIRSAKMVSCEVGRICKM